jgi:hypothetical protein
MASNLSEISAVLSKGLQSCTANTRDLVVAVKLDVHEIVHPYRLTSIMIVFKMSGKLQG